MHPADEMAYEQACRESDPLNLDGDAMHDREQPVQLSDADMRLLGLQIERDNAKEMVSIAVAVARIKEKITLPRYASFIKIDARGCATEIKGGIAKAEAGLACYELAMARAGRAEAEEGFEALVDRVSDLESDAYD